MLGKKTWAINNINTCLYYASYFTKSFACILFNFLINPTWSLLIASLFLKLENWGTEILATLPNIELWSVPKHFRVGAIIYKAIITSDMTGTITEVCVQNSGFSKGGVVSCPWWVREKLTENISIFRVFWWMERNWQGSVFVCARIEGGICIVWRFYACTHITMCTGCAYEKITHAKTICDD
jgi:hypothetical protein